MTPWAASSQFPLGSRFVSAPSTPAAAPSSAATQAHKLGSVSDHSAEAVGGLTDAKAKYSTAAAVPEEAAAPAAAAASSEGKGLAYMIPRPALIPGRWQGFAETVFGFEGTGGLTQQYFGILVPTFTLLLAYNLSGLVPGAPVDRMFGAISLGLAVNMLLSLTILGFGSWGFHFISFLLPAGAPLWLAPLLVVIESFSYCSRAISLGFRLFANLTAGHCMLKIFAGAGLSPPKGKVIAFASKLGAGALIGSVLGAFTVSGIEMLACFLQAYVFTMLTTYYINDVLGEPVKLRAVSKAVQQGVKHMPK